jgi:hypothetical protein
LPEPSLAELIDEMMNVMEENEQPFIYDSEYIDSDEKCECGTDITGGGIHSNYCPKYKEK